MFVAIRVVCRCRENFTGNGSDALTSRSPWTMASRWPRSKCIKITGSSSGGGGAVSRMSAATEPDLTRDDKAGKRCYSIKQFELHHDRPCPMFQGRRRCRKRTGMCSATTTIHLCVTFARHRRCESLHCCTRWVIRRTLVHFNYVTVRQLLSPLLTFS